MFTPRSTTPRPVIPKRGPGRPRKKPRSNPDPDEATEIVPASIEEEKNNEVNDSSAGKTNECAKLLLKNLYAESPVKPVRQVYSHAQKTRIAQYARFHGPRAASRKFNVHHCDAE